MGVPEAQLRSRAAANRRAARAWRDGPATRAQHTERGLHGATSVWRWTCSGGYRLGDLCTKEERRTGYKGSYRTHDDERLRVRTVQSCMTRDRAGQAENLAYYSRCLAVHMHRPRSPPAQKREEKKTAHRLKLVSKRSLGCTGELAPQS